MSEFTRLADVRYLTEAPVRLVADEAERRALAGRFGLVAVHALEAEIALTPDGPAVDAKGRFKAEIVQSCAVSGEDLPVTIDEAFAVRFVPEGPAPAPAAEIELDEHELDEIPFAGTQFDLGEAVAQSLALAVDPYATGPGAEEARRKAGIVDESANGPFAALGALVSGKSGSGKDE